MVCRPCSLKLRNSQYETADSFGPIHLPLEKCCCFLAACCDGPPNRTEKKLENIKVERVQIHYGKLHSRKFGQFSTHMLSEQGVENTFHTGCGKYFPHGVWKTLFHTICPQWEIWLCHTMLCSRDHFCGWLFFRESLSLF